MTYTALLQTTDKAVSKIDADNATTSEKEDGDIEGPFTIALAAAKTENDTSSRFYVVIYGFHRPDRIGKQRIDVY